MRAASESDDPAVADVVAYLESLDEKPLDAAQLQVKCGVAKIDSNANFAFRHESDAERLLSDRPKVRAWWSEQRKKSVGAPVRCLVTGDLVPPIDNHPKLKKVWGGLSGGVTLVSFNDVAFESFGLQGNDNAPIGRPAAEAITAALNRMLDKDYPDPATGAAMPRRCVRIAPDTTVLFWSKNPDAPVDLFGDGIDADPAAVKALYEAPHKGRPPALENESPFFALALAGEMARAKVRGWYQTTLGSALRNVRDHFDDIEIVRRDAEPMPLWRLLRSLALLGDYENLHPNLASATFGAVIEGRPYPRALLEGAVRRARAEREVTAERAAAIKAYLVILRGLV